jgi:maltooligosyltrehalose trehalohydrolase
MIDHFAWSMPFGAQYGGGTQTRFRLWAPSLSGATLAHESRDRRLPMTAIGDGWFELTAEAQPGDLYRFLLPDGSLVPDPASRCQAADVHDPSVVVDPRAYRWRVPQWRSRPWHEAVIYELHVGTFSAQGGFAGVRDHLPRLAELGITAIELMPIAEFSGARNWGYDGVLPFAPEHSYGAPDDLKALIDAAHELDLMVLLDVVYNHFGPDGNYLHRYAPQAFTERRQTPWGAAIDYARPPVREFFVHNALYWLEEFRFDGLRLDAVHQIVDDGTPHLLNEIAEAVRDRIGNTRHVHLVLENDDNAPELLAPGLYTAQWNDDFHHAAHVVLTGEASGYYADYADDPVARLGRALAEGFVYQGEHSGYRDQPRGGSSAHLPSTAFVDFLQNHDQIGNRAFGERLTAQASPAALQAMRAILLLSPAIPMLFMGEEHGASEPFRYFVDFQGELATAVRDGRRREFSRFADFADPAARDRIPDPTDPATHAASVVDWRRQADPPHSLWLEDLRALLAVRFHEIVPRLTAGVRAARFELVQPQLLSVRWTFADGAGLRLIALLSDQPLEVPDLELGGRRIWPLTPVEDAPRRLPAWFISWYLRDADGR